jgi:hypothetical protein
MRLKLSSALLNDHYSEGLVAQSLTWLPERLRVREVAMKQPATWSIDTKLTGTCDLVNCWKDMDFTPKRGWEENDEE